MGFSTFPAPASTVSTSTLWTQIATSSPTSGLQVAFTGISGYKKLYLLIENITLSGASALTLTINSDTGSKYWARYFLTSSNAPNFSLVGGTTVGTNLGVGYATQTGGSSASIIIDNADSSTIKEISGYVYQNANANSDKGFVPGTVYKGAATVSSIQVNTTQSFVAGTITLYGAAS